MNEKLIKLSKALNKLLAACPQRAEFSPCRIGIRQDDAGRMFVFVEDQFNPLTMIRVEVDDPNRQKLIVADSIVLNLAENNLREAALHLAGVYKEMEFSGKTNLPMADWQWWGFLAWKGCDLTNAPVWWLVPAMEMVGYEFGSEIAIPVVE
jgi:hypothetical protein